MDTHIARQDLSSQTATATAADRRVAPRYPSSRKVACYPVGSGFRDRRQARVRDVSRVGIGLSLDRAFSAGTVLVVELPAEEGAKPVRARVVHSTALIGSMFHVGCSFESLISEAEVQALTQ